MNRLTDEQITALNETAIAVGASPASLYRLILFESGWNPAAKNPNSSARGLIQFIDSTARDLGYTSSADLVARHPTIAEQLRGPVLEYLAQWGPYPNDQSLFMGVFYPAAINWPAGKEFPAWVTEANPGIRTPGDYMAKVYAIQDLSDNEIQSAINAGNAIDAGGLLLVAGAAVALWLISQNT